MKNAPWESARGKNPNLRPSDIGLLEDGKRKRTNTLEVLPAAVLESILDQLGPFELGYGLGCASRGYRDRCRSPGRWFAVACRAAEVTPFVKTARQTFAHRSCISGSRSSTV